jgi:hypothetical protein
MIIGANFSNPAITKLISLRATQHFLWSSVQKSDDQRPFNYGLITVIDAMIYRPDPSAISQVTFSP